jgi:signal transduction histidine kinase
VSAAPPQPHAWDRGTRGWDLYNAVVLGSVLVLVVGLQLAADQPAPKVIVTGLALLAMVPWYAVHRRGVLYGDGSLARGLVYLAGLWVLFAIATSQGIPGAFLFLLLALGPQCFLAVPFRWAVGAIVVLDATPLVVWLVSGGGGRTDLATLATSAVLSVAFSIALGRWIYTIIDQSRERASLIEELGRTRAELAAANRQAGVLAERQRLAGEIHDTVAQGFTSIIMLLQAADAAVPHEPATARKHLALALQAARDNLAEARALVAALAPADLESAALDGALRRLTDTAAAQREIAAEFEVTGTPRPLPRPAEVMLLRVGQEALANAGKHAQAGRILVRLRYADGVVGLDVTDDGIGFEPGRPAGGFGLRGMRTRVDQQGGRLDVRSTPGQGTTVSVELPLLNGSPVSRMAEPAGDG